MAQGVEALSSKCKVLSSIPSITKNMSISKIVIETYDKGPNWDTVCSRQDIEVSSWWGVEYLGSLRGLLQLG
jgi:hypothetical protein